LRGRGRGGGGGGCGEEWGRGGGGPDRGYSFLGPRWERRVEGGSSGVKNGRGDGRWEYKGERCKGGAMGEREDKSGVRRERWEGGEGWN